jgi:synaptojanin
MLTQHLDCLNRSEYDYGYGQEPNPYYSQGSTSDDFDYGGGPDPTEIAAEHPFHTLQKLLNSGNFYYSVDFDLTSRLQDR